MFQKLFISLHAEQTASTMVQEIRFKNLLPVRDEAVLNVEPTKDAPINNTVTMPDGVKLHNLLPYLALTPPESPTTLKFWTSYDKFEHWFHHAMTSQDAFSFSFSTITLIGISQRTFKTSMKHTRNCQKTSARYISSCLQRMVLPATTTIT
jgi:hypothetical protein